MIDAIKKAFNKYLGFIMLILISIILYRVIITTDFKKIFNSAVALMNPFIIGLIIAYIFNPIIGFFEKRFLRLNFFKSRPKGAKTLSMLMTYLLIAALICFVIVSIIPQIIASIQGISSYLFTYLPKLESAINKAVSGIDANGTLAEDFINSFRNTINSIFDTALNGVKYVPDVMSTVLTSTFNIAGWILNFVIGIIISIYMLREKPNLLKSCRKVFYVILPEKYFESFGEFVRYANETFEKFFISKAVDSIIIAVIFFFGCCFISPDYALLFACVIGITNMIPYFGPFIGAVPVVILCLLQNPYSAIWMTIFVFILQQFDGYILGPRVMGDSIGIKPMGVIFAILVGGGLFGFLGMFFGVPVYAVISKTISGFINTKVSQKETLYEKNTADNKETAEEEVL
ncbi:MAG: AI-2E family transporter [Clostridiales bacterium]|nr:AI-2E family transporter [Clostridiales bacterium]